MFSDINSIKCGLFYLIGQPNTTKGTAAKIKDGIISETKLLETISVVYTKRDSKLHFLSLVSPFSLV